MVRAGFACIPWGTPVRVACLPGKYFLISALFQVSGRYVRVLDAAG